MKRYLKLGWVWAAILVALPLQAASSKTTSATSTLNLEKGENTVEFLAVGRPGALKIHGQTVKTAAVANPLKGQLKIDQGAVTGTATFALDALDTGIDLRTHHMKEKYLETAKYPLATVKITKLALPTEFSSPAFSKDGIPFEGELTLHGATKPVKGTVNVERKAENAKMTFEFPVALTEYGIDIPSFAGITVAKEVTATVKVNSPLQSETKTSAETKAGK